MNSNKKHLNGLFTLIFIFCFSGCLESPFDDDNDSGIDKKPDEYDGSTYQPQLDTMKVVYINWDDTISIKSYLPEDSVSFIIKGGDVIVNSFINDTIEYVLRGSSNDGSFKIYSESLFNLVLDEITLINNDGPALNIQSKKRGYVYIYGDDPNSFTDGATYSAPEDPLEDQKGAVFSEGKLIIDGDKDAVLNVVSKSRHGICSDAYVSILGGVINIDAEVDGIHANDEVSVSGGTVTIIAKSDGMECEAGKVVVEGGNINITCGDKGYVTSYSGSSSKISPSVEISGGNTDIKVTAVNGKGVRSIGDFVMTDGYIKVHAPYDQNEGIESKKKMTISGGTIEVECYDNGLNSGTDMVIEGGNIFSFSTGNDGIDSNARIYVSGGVIVTAGVGSGESGFDCANNTFMISGGTMIGLGEQTSRPSSLSSQNSLIYKGALETGSTILLTDNSGKELFAFKLPAGINSTTTLISLPEMTDGTGYKLIGNATFAGDNFNGYYSAPEIYGGTLISEFNVSSPVTDLQ